MPESLKTILEQYGVNTLSALASCRGIKFQAKRSKAEIGSRLAGLFADPEQIKSVLPELSPAEKMVIQTLLRSGGETGLFTIRQRLLASQLIDPLEEDDDLRVGRQPSCRLSHSRRLDEIMAHLLALGLVFARPYKDTYGYQVSLDLNLANEYFIPDTVRRHLPEPEPEAPMHLEPIAPPAQIDESSARVFQRDLYLYWSYLRKNHVELTAKNLMTKRHLVALNDGMLVRETIQTGQVEADFPRLVFIRALLTQLGLIDARSAQSGQGAALRVAAAKPGENFFALDPQGRIKKCFEAYLACRMINEIAWENQIQMIYAQSPLIPAPDALLSARRTVQKFLQPFTGWAKIETLVAQIRGEAYEFLFRRNYRVPGMYYSASAYRSNPYSSYGNPFNWQFPQITNEAQGWEQVEARFIITMLRGPLFWMGLVEMGCSAPNLAQADEFRLTAPGSWLLAKGAAPEIAQSGGQVIVQPDFTITALDPISDAVLFDLDQFAERTSAERAILFRLTQQSVYAAQQEGWDAARIRAYLENLSGQSLPENLARTLADWQARHERIRILPHAAILHARDPQDLQALSGERGLAGWLQDEPAPGLAILPASKDLGQLVSLLMQNQWLPLISEGQTEIPSQSVDVTEEGILNLKVASADLYLHGYLARFADSQEEECYRLTPDSVRRAVVSGMTGVQILADLKKVARGTLPAAVEKNILAWSGHYGQAVLEEVALLRVKDEATLHELLRDRELGALLTRIKPAETEVTVRVRKKDAERVKRLLEERGAEVKRRE